MTNFDAFDCAMMALAIQLAKQGRYTTRPNPRVGAVLVKAGAIVGQGWHQRAGEGHAEVNAIRDAGVEASGATAYVTLEPCSHHGRTPPCCEALINAGVSKVIYGMKDPNPLVSGQGEARLLQAGILVQSGCCELECWALNPGFISRMTVGRPLVRVKMAMSLDGHTAMQNGYSKWITCDAARHDVHRLRAASDVVLTGSGTALADDPQLNVRLSLADLGLSEGQVLPQPDRVLLDSRLVISDDAALLSAPEKLRVFHAETADSVRAAELQRRGVNCHAVGSNKGGVDLDEILKTLADLAVNEVLVEAGATLAGRFVEQGLVDELIIYMAPHLMGDAGRPLFNLPSIRRMDDRKALKIKDIRAVGSDFRITAAMA